MQFCVHVTAVQEGFVHVEADSEDQVRQEVELLFQQHNISWHNEEITEIATEEVYA